MGCFIIHMMDAKNPFKHRQWLLLLSFQLGSFWEKKVHICKVIYNKASIRVTLRVLVLFIISQKVSWWMDDIVFRDREKKKLLNV